MNMGHAREVSMLDRSESTTWFASGMDHYSHRDNAVWALGSRSDLNA